MRMLLLNVYYLINVYDGFFLDNQGYILNSVSFKEKDFM